MGIVLSEHNEYYFKFIESEADLYHSVAPRQFPSERNEKYCFQATIVNSSIILKSNYYVGVDWLINGSSYVQVKPKLNIKLIKEFEKETDTTYNIQEDNLDAPPVYDDDKDYKQLNYIKLLIEAFQHPSIVKHTNNLVIIDWESEQITIDQEDDVLTPFLVVQFLNLLKQIVRKGLKKSYYKVQENLNNRIKGKILVGANIKQNVLKNRLTKTLCEYQEFGINHQENRLLKKVLFFCSYYVHQNANLFEGNRKNLEQLLSYCKPAFQLVSDETETATLRNIKHNPFFKEYKEAIKIGQYILKRFAYNISNTAKSKKIRTPPFWIDMPKLFELYVYNHILSVFDSNEIEYQFSTYGNSLDFLITKEGREMVVDAKYKMHYRSSHIHEDIRQVAGYARLNKVYDKLNLRDCNRNVDCLIIYPTDEELTDNYKFKCILNESSEIKAYQRVFKIGIPMPYIKID